MPHDPARAILKSRNYLWKELPKSLSKCAKESLAYGNCVAQWDNLRKGDCQKEFTSLRQCLKKVK